MVEKVLSTDAIGLADLGIGNFINAWRPYFERGIFDGLEAITLTPGLRLNSIIGRLEKNKMTVSSLHGQAGDCGIDLWDRFVVKSSAQFMFPTGRLLKEYGGNLEILFHTPHAAEDNVKQMVYSDKPKLLWIENCFPGPEDMIKTMELVEEYRENGVNASGLIDIYHYCSNLTPEQIAGNWPQIVADIKSYLQLSEPNGKRLFTAIHFPMGENKKDSLPMHLLSDQDLALFGREIIPLLDKIVIENQQSKRRLLFSTKKDWKREEVINKAKIERLIAAGILSLD